MQNKNGGKKAAKKHQKEKKDKTLNEKPIQVLQIDLT